MSAGANASEPSWPILNALERRILGVLVEKAKTTPDAYPLTMNSLINGCNQKSNRDPVMDVDENDLQDCLEELQRRGFVVIVTGTRVDRWRHQLYEIWTSDKAQLAVLTELLLRGPQTEGELRSRVSRMEPIEDIDQLREVLQPLAERKLVIYLTPQGRRGTTLTHGFHPPEELTRLKVLHATGIAPPEVAPTPLPRPPPSVPQPTPDPNVITRLETRLTEAWAEIDRHKSELQTCKTEIAQLRDSLKKLQHDLGIAPAEMAK